MATAECRARRGITFYDNLNQLLAEAGVDRRCEELCASYYADGTGWPSIPPGVYFRMLFVGYFEGLTAQRAIAWKCADSFSVRTFLGLEVTAAAPDHSSLTRIRQRPPLEVHVQAFQWVLEVAQAKGVLRGKVLAIDATTLEAKAAMSRWCAGSVARSGWPICVGWLRLKGWMIPATRTCAALTVSVRRRRSATPSGRRRSIRTPAS